MEGAIICKADNCIHILAIGQYEALQNRLDIYCKIAGENEIKLINTTGMDIESIKMDQTLVNKLMGGEFENRSS